MENKKILNYCIDYLSKKSVDESECLFTSHKLYEMGSENDKISLLRTNYTQKIEITAIKDNKKSTITTNELSEEDLNKTLEKAVKLTESSKADEDYRVSPKQDSKTSSKGDKKPNLDKMFEVLKNLIADITKTFPKISLRNVVLKFDQYDKKYLNSNSTYFESYKAYYTFAVTFMAKDGDKISSFNYTGASFTELPDDLFAFGNLKDILEQTTKQLEPAPVSEKFEGDVIITPQCLGDIVGMLTRLGLQGQAIYTKNSLLVDKLNESIADKSFTLHSNPVADDISNGYFITKDGYTAENLTIVDKGVLKSFLLDEYSAKKAKMERSKNNGRAFVVDPGNADLADMVKNIKKGLFVARLSFGQPATNGDFSGIAKNSFYIENGEIKNAVNETMIFGNVYKMLNSINEISKDRVNLGNSIYPWISFNGITISGK